MRRIFENIKKFLQTVFLSSLPDQIHSSQNTSKRHMSIFSSDCHCFYNVEILFSKGSKLLAADEVVLCVFQLREVVVKTGLVCKDS